MKRSVIDCREVIARVRGGARQRRLRAVERVSIEAKSIAAKRLDAGEPIRVLAAEFSRTEQTIYHWWDCWHRGVGPWRRHKLGERWLPRRAGLAVVA